MKTDKWSAILNGVGLIFYLIGTIYLLVYSLFFNIPGKLPVIILYMITSLVYWAMNTSYHTLRYHDIHNIFFRKLDHVSVFFLIVGTFTPCILSYGTEPGRTIILAIIWILVLVGSLLVIFWKKIPEGTSVIISFLLAVICIISMIVFINNVPITGILTFFIGTGLFVAGGIIYALKKPDLKYKTYGSHEFYHTLALIGTIFLYFFVYMAIMS
ncbi:MAG: hemolysin III family protein [Candidatus Hodarchaeota archaeon]